MSIFNVFKNNKKIVYNPKANIEIIRFKDLIFEVRIVELPKIYYENVCQSDFIGSTDDYINSKDLSRFNSTNLLYSYDKIYKVECCDVKFYISDKFKDTKYFNKEFIAKVILKRLKV